MIPRACEDLTANDHTQVCTGSNLVTDKVPTGDGEKNQYLVSRHGSSPGSSIMVRLGAIHMSDGQAVRAVTNCYP